MRFSLASLSPRTRIMLACAAMIVTVIVCERAMGRLWFGPDGQFGWWAGNVWSSEQSQRVADPYSFSHVTHGLIFYLLVWIFGRKLPLHKRFLIAVGLEAGWEVLENSSIIIDRYRAATISYGYTGDSILNSVSDIFMMMGGFWIAARVKPWMSVAVVLLLELAMLFWIRDTLALNLIMLAYPIESLKAWQAAGQPLP